MVQLETWGKGKISGKTSQNLTPNTVGHKLDMWVLESCLQGKANACHPLNLVTSARFYLRGCRTTASFLEALFQFYQLSS